MGLAQSSHSSSSVNDNKFVFFKVFVLFLLLCELWSVSLDFDDDDFFSSELDSVVVFFGFLNMILPPAASSSAETRSLSFFKLATLISLRLTYTLYWEPGIPKLIVIWG